MERSGMRDSPTRIALRFIRATHALEIQPRFFYLSLIALLLKLAP
jgi:hypothetical protein